MESQAVLQKIEDNREITWDRDCEFLFEYQNAMLLALKELGTLDDIQYRYAKEFLQTQCRTFAVKKRSCNIETGGAAND